MRRARHCPAEKRWGVQVTEGEIEKIQDPILDIGISSVGQEK
jgi:hypothetical protein